MVLRGSIGKRRRSGIKSGRSYESMMKTLLLQNQQIIIQQQNMMFMVMKQFHPTANVSMQTHDDQTNSINQSLRLNNNFQQQNTLQEIQQQRIFGHHQQQQLHPTDVAATSQASIVSTPPTTTPVTTSSNSTITLQQINRTNQMGNHNHNQHHHHHIESNEHNTNVDRHLQQVATHLQENLGNYLTPAASEQDPISENGKPDSSASESDALSALLEGDGLLTNNLLYNPCTDIGSITPYKNHHSDQQQHQQQHHHHEHQTPSYYSSGCESLSTPRVEQQRQTVNISQNVVKNLNNSFKSPSKPQINVQILSGSATREMRKAKIIQSMNISEFLRQVHHDDAQKSSTQ